MTGVSVGRSASGENDRTAGERFIHSLWDAVFDVDARTCESGGYCYVCEVQRMQDAGMRR